jgi:hypothetical protein
MVRLFVLLANYAIIGSADCNTTKYYTECSNEGLRDVIVASTGDCDSYNIYRSMDCKFECPPGTILDIVNGVQTCTKCPSGTFNNGPGAIYGGNGLDWSQSLKKMINQCWVTFDYLNFLNYQCKGWKVQQDLLVSGDTSLKTAFSSGLLFSVNLVKPGSISIMYRKETSIMSGVTIGSFSINLNEIQVYIDDVLEDSTWKIVYIPLTQGMQEVYIEYKTINSRTNSNLHGYISWIEVNGTSYSSLECYPCLRGANDPGSTSCDVCGYNEYWNIGKCDSCPPDKYSLQGSVGINSCRARLPCTRSDYMKSYSECINDSRNLSYVWKDPLICDYLNYTLPEDQFLIDCEACGAGYYIESTNNITRCLPCPDGQYRSNETSCQNCTAGTYALKTYTFSNWEGLPEGFSTYCKTYNGNFCSNSSGWVPNIDYIFSNSLPEPNAEIFLEKTVNITANTGILTLTCEFINYNNGILNIYIDRAWVGEINWPGKVDIMIDLKHGIHLIQLVYTFNTTSDEEIKIFQIYIEGCSEGAATKCLKCPDGYISADGQDACVPCSPGYSSDSSHSVCKLCPSYTYSSQGSECIKCPTGTVNNHNKTNCIGLEYVYFKERSFYIQNITGHGQLEEKYTGGVCTMAASKIFCHQTFYGPLPGNDKEFYISILNPSLLHLPSVSYFFEPTKAYAYGILKKQDIIQIKSDLNQGDAAGFKKNVCENTETIVNLGTVVSDVALRDNGFTITYAKGDLCDHYGNTYKTTIDFICDKNSAIGWPSYKSNDECNFNFVWKSKYGCGICIYNDLPTITGECENGLRQYYKIENEDCIIPFSNEISWKETCTEIEDFINTWPMILGLSLLGVLVILALVSFVVYYKYRRGYKKLQEIKE